MNMMILATNIMENKVFTTPEPMDDEDFEKFFQIIFRINL